MTDPDLVEARLRSLQIQVQRMDAERADSAKHLRGALLVTVLSGALLALTCGTWRENVYEVRFTLWGMVDSVGFEALLVLALVVGTALGSVLLAASSAKATVLRRSVGVVALVTAGTIVYLNSVLREGTLDTAAWVSLAFVILLGCLTIVRTLEPFDWR
ncbi:hypothetical protein [Actinokineospora globicatena]|uniref:hypothetical protein n=1 Tax=Actinokineospora globicatena TaxID=103729 RepID=UPI0020A374D7|nr:hypothetical protein [Actinokineospora globicatena]MCP2303689.1 hypothetical protein [Actinokineospora globicatena]GLW79173.1 hypothetical protein Aglo01_36550 [Actinokineospora globicatena]GLW86417.1 hypothetical protein Aglo02_40560 [Actinokineospora globicatena]